MALNYKSQSLVETLSGKKLWFKVIKRGGCKGMVYVYANRNKVKPIAIVWRAENMYDGNGMYFKEAALS